MEPVPDPDPNTWSVGRLIREVIKDKPTCTRWLIQQKLHPIKMRCDEDHEMKLDVSRDGVAGSFRCRRNHKDGKRRAVSRFKGTLFDTSRLPPEKILMIGLMYSNEYTCRAAMREMSFFGGRPWFGTVWNWYSYFREIVSQWLLSLDDDEAVLGGRGTVVEIEEEKFQQPKMLDYNPREGEFIFGILERSTNRFQLKVCPVNERTDDVLSDFIDKHVLPYTTVVSDSYVVKKLLASTEIYDFKGNKDVKPDPKTGEMLPIERTWHYLKERLEARKNCRSRDLGELYMEYLFRRKMAHEKIDPFDKLIDLIRHNHPVRERLSLTQPVKEEK